MSSLLTNNSAMTALQALTMTQASLSQTQNQISTGQRISSAADNASYWSIATKMHSNIGALGAASDALSESSALVSTMSAALTSSISVLDIIKNDLVSASNPGADMVKINGDIANQQQLLESIGQSANFNGLNFLAGSGANGTVNLVASYDSKSGVSYLSVDTSQTQLFQVSGGVYNSAGTVGILAQTSGNVSGQSILSFTIGASTTVTTTGTGVSINNLLTDVETALSSITKAGALRGATTNSITTQQNYVSNLSDSLTTGVGALVDANMNEASTKLAALQVQQQLGIQALSIANSNTQLILKLFQ